jgi:hypothetical protein
MQCNTSVFGMLCRVSCLLEANLLNVARKTDPNNYHSNPPTPPLPGAQHIFRRVR